MIIALISKKGGVGKTTTAVNLSAALATGGKRVLLVDLDSQGSSSLSLGYRRGEFPPSAADVLLGGRPVQEAIRTTTLPSLDLLTSSADLASFDEAVAKVRGRQGRLVGALAPVRALYDFILLDCPPSLSLLPINALVASDAFVVPVMPHYLALEGLDNLIQSALRICHSQATRTRLLGVLLTMVDYRTRLTRQNVDHIRSEYRDRVFAIEIRTNVRLAEAPGFGQTIFQYDPRSTGAKAYSLLAQELALRLGLTPPEERRREKFAQVGETRPYPLAAAPSVPV